MFRYVHHIKKNKEINNEKSIFSLLAALLLVSLVACTTKEKENDGWNKDYKVAMVTDYGDITDQSFNQATYEGAKAWCEENKVHFTYKKPVTNSDADRIAATEKAIDEGYNVIVMPGYAFAPTIQEVAGKNPNVKFIALDVSKGDFAADYELPSNVYCAVYQEELAGYMAGYAAVKEGYKKLGFLGGMSVPAVVRFGYGFVQGCNAAATETNTTIEIKYAYAKQFFGDAEITAVMDTWYGDGVEVVFACGGGVYTSACEAAQKTNGKVIGVDTDQSYIINEKYAKGMCITSAMKGLAATVKTQLSKTILEGKFESKIETLGLVSATDLASNYVQLPTATWSMTKFTVEDYKTLVGKLYNKEITVKSATSADEVNFNEIPNVKYLGNLK